jgi:hypothetical protein
MFELSGSFVRRGHIRDRRDPALAIRGLEHLAKRDDFVMQSGAGRFLRLAGLSIEPRCLAMSPIFLHLARRNVFNGRITKERGQVDADDVRLRLHIVRVALAERDHLELVSEGFGGVRETRPGRLSPPTAIGGRAGIGN